jgi:hypothetical protein
MKRLAALILCACLAAEAAPSSLKSPGPGRPLSPWVVDIHELVPSLRPLPQKEREDQLRDWALYGLLMRLGLSADDMARTTHQLAPMRLPYLQELFAFEYGPGRQAILSDQRVLLLSEASDPDPQATLGRLADRVRMEMGTVPTTFELYTFSADVSGGELRLEFKQSVPGTALFSALYGYHEALITDSQGLDTWLQSVDDVVFVATQKQGLKLGGRRFAKSRTLGATLEDVAVLYQAHSSLAAQQERLSLQVDDARAQARRELDRALPEELRRVQNMYPFDERSQRSELDRRMRARAQDFMQSALRNTQPVPPEPGFSLDPQWDERGLVDSLEGLAVNPCGTLDELGKQAKQSIERLKETKAWPGMVFSAWALYDRDINELRARCKELKRSPLYAPRLQQAATSAHRLISGASEEDALEPLYALKNELKDSTGAQEHFLWDVLQLAIHANKKQCARYDGPLGGTRVGMNLFYTDLLAKLWALDVNNEAPGLRVPGFVSLSRLPPSPYREEERKMSATRLWFGPKKEAFTRSPEGAELRFQHVATRVFSAGSDSGQLKGKEGTANDSSRRALGWWERHYAQVADYEQQYHLQNQIMKWSVITGFFREKQLAAYLDQVPVGRGAHFAEWYEHNSSGLKYQLPLLVGGARGHECMDILATRGGFAGGVSLSGGKLSEVPMVTPSEPASLRHSLKAITGGKSAEEQLGRAMPEHIRPGVVRVEPLPTTRARSQGVQLELGPMELVHLKTKPGTYEQTLRTPTALMGHFSGNVTPGRTTLHWNSGQLAETLFLARSNGSTEEAIFTHTMTVGALAPRKRFSLPWYSEMHGPNDREVEILSANGEVGTRVRRSRVSSPSLSEPARQESLLAHSDWQRLTVTDQASGLETSQGVSRWAEAGGPSSDAHSMQARGMKKFPEGLEIVVSEGGEVYVPRPPRASASKSWEQLSFTARDVAKFKRAARNGRTTIDISELSNPRAEEATRALAGEDKRQFRREFQALSKELGPDKSSQEIRRHMEDAAHLRLAHGDTPEAARLYELAQDQFGESSPGVLIQQTLAQLHAGKVGPASLEEVLARHLSELNLQERFQVMEALNGLKDMPDVAEVVKARLGFQSSIPEAVLPRVHLERDGPKVVSAYHAEELLRVAPISPDEFKDGVPKSAAIYVEDGASFNNNDFELNVAENMAELGHNPEVTVERLLSMGPEDVRPGTLYGKPEAQAPESTYHLVTSASTAEKARSSTHPGTSASAAKDAKSPIYVIRHRQFDTCDTNKDGEVSDEERLLCKAA